LAITPEKSVSFSPTFSRATTVAPSFSASLANCSARPGAVGLAVVDHGDVLLAGLLHQVLGANGPWIRSVVATRK
jgi:hypothetical protein